MIIFIVPYRQRPAELSVFLSHMKYILEDVEDEYFIYIINQADERPFNRGAMRNIGFLMAKEQFPENYKDIDLVFHDLDNLIGENNQVDFKTMTATGKVGKVRLTEQEAKLLKLFLTNPGKPLSRNKLLQIGWGYTKGTTTRTVDNFIVRFRKYFEDNPKNPSYFISIRSIGYVFNADPVSNKEK